jgi:hypothetical protein
MFVAVMLNFDFSGSELSPSKGSSTQAIFRARECQDFDHASLESAGNGSSTPMIVLRAAPTRPLHVWIRRMRKYELIYRECSRRESRFWLYVGRWKCLRSAEGKLLAKKLTYCYFVQLIAHCPLLSKLAKRRSRQRMIARVASLRKTNSLVFACVSKSCLWGETEL